MAKRLLDRQIRLLEYLTSGAAIFGGNPATMPDRTLHGIDRRLLDLEARFSYAKRMEKIAAVYPKTIAMLGRNQTAIFEDFVAACPPSDLSRLANARQFYDFLLTRWQSKPPRPRYLREVAACELACAEVRVTAQEDGPGGLPGPSAVRRGDIRRRAGVVLLRCSYDIKAIFEERPGRGSPARRSTSLAVAMPPGTHDPCVFEVEPAVFDLLGALDEWTDPIGLGIAPELDDLIRELADHGLVEVRG